MLNLEKIVLNFNQFLSKFKGNTQYYRDSNFLILFTSDIFQIKYDILRNIKCNFKKDL